MKPTRCDLLLAGVRHGYDEAGDGDERESKRAMSELQAACAAAGKERPARCERARARERRLRGARVCGGSGRSGRLIYGQPCAPASP